jgi:hypothetical protein
MMCYIEINTVYDIFDTNLITIFLTINDLFITLNYLSFPERGNILIFTLKFFNIKDNKYIECFANNQYLLMKTYRYYIMFNICKERK